VLTATRTATPVRPRATPVDNRYRDSRVDGDTNGDAGPDRDDHTGRDGNHYRDPRVDGDSNGDPNGDAGPDGHLDPDPHWDSDTDPREHAVLWRWHRERDEQCDTAAPAPQCPNSGGALQTCALGCLPVSGTVAFSGDAAAPESILDTGFSGISHRAPIITNGDLTIDLNCAATKRPCGTCP
jgi:hypothetical protein